MGWPQIVEVALVVALAYAASLLVWAVAAPDPRPSAGLTPPPVAAPARASRDIAALRRFDPFHRVLPTAEADRAAEQAAPETSLDLALYGVRAGADGEIGSATIRGLDKQQRAYRVGEEIGEGSGVYLRRILPDRAVLSNRGVLESLFFPNTDRAPTVAASRGRAGAAARAPDPEPAQGAGAAPDQVGARVSSVSLPANYDALSAAFEARPLLNDDEEIVGVRLLPKGDGGLFDRAGLKAGDQLLAVNGQRAATAEQAFAVFEGLRDAPEIRLDVLRAGEAWTINIAFEE